MKCVRIEPRKQAEVVEIENDLPALQAAVGGYIQVVPLPFPGAVGIVDEEGKLRRNQQFNRVATELAGIGDYIVGTMLIVGTTRDGEFTDAPADALAVAHKPRLEELRAALRAENISYGELAELANLAEYIDADDVELLEAAGVPEDA
jgi:hypothetical protein